MTQYIKHAKREFEILGWPGDCETQAMICDNIIDLLKVVSNQGHSGSSLPYLVSLFDKLVKFDPISPLTGDDSEWNEVGDGLYQNKRDSAVFKEHGKAYWIDGKIFQEEDGNCYTSGDSRVDVEFPWTKPKPEYVKVKNE